MNEVRVEKTEGTRHPLSQLAHIFALRMDISEPFRDLSVDLIDSND